MPGGLHSPLPRPAIMLLTLTEARTWPGAAPVEGPPGRGGAPGRTYCQRKSGWHIQLCT